ncbi:MAG: hypothetical protein E7576_07055 [Ruminococcaceae bacterium]|nr:hypothetical protein [Oscillospiraceae bacterium]
MKAKLDAGTVKKRNPITEQVMRAEAERMAKEAIAEMNRENEAELDAMVLYILHTEFGFGEKRLRRFYDRFSEGLRELGERYAMNEYDEKIWLCQRKLKEAGIDISKWEEEDG